MDCSLPHSSIHGIFQARVLEWVAISFSRGSSRPGIEPGLLHCRQMFYHLSHHWSLSNHFLSTHLKNHLLLPFLTLSLIKCTSLCQSHNSTHVLISLPAFSTLFSISSVSQSCLTHCDPMDWSMPGFPVHHQLPEFTQTHVHWVGESFWRPATLYRCHTLKPRLVTEPNLGLLILDCGEGKCRINCRCKTRSLGY